MRVAQPLSGWLSMLAVCGVLTSCRTLEPELPAGEYSPVLVPLDEDQEVLAEVLAHYARGILHDLDREYDAALTNYLHAVELDPSNEELHVRIAMGLLQQKRTDEALQLIEGLAEREPESESAQAWLALVYRASEESEKAIGAYRRLIEISPEKPGPYIELAGYYLRLGRKDLTIETLERGIKKAGDKLEIYRALSKLYIDEANGATSADAKGVARGKAITLLQKAVKLAEEDVNLRLQLGDLQIREGHPGRAIRQFRAIEERYPDDLGIKRRLAMSFLSMGEKGEAIETLEAMSAADPTNEQLYYYLGELYQEEGEYDKAVLNFSLAATASTDNPAPYVRLATIQIGDDGDAAIQTLYQALEKLPGNPRLTELLGHAYLANEQYELALEWLRKAEARLGDAAQGRLYYQIAKASFLTQNQPDALAAISRAMDEDTRYLQAFVADVLDQDNLDLEAAVDLFQQLADGAADEPAVFLYLGMVKSFAERYEEAILDFARVGALADENERNGEIISDTFYFSYAAAHERLGHYEQAEDLFKKALHLNDQHSVAHNYLAYMWAERGVNLDEALEHVRIALEIEPDSGAFIDTLGWIHYQQGNYEDALREILRAMELTPGDPTVTDHLADTLYKLERTEEAIEQWTASFLLDPEGESVAEKLTEHGVDLEPLREESARLAEAREAEQAARRPADRPAPLGDGRVPRETESPLDEIIRDPEPEDMEQRMQDLGVPISPTNAPPPVIQMAPDGIEPAPGSPSPLPTTP